MTREQKIQNILDATKVVLEEMMKNGELTAERAAAILECQTMRLRRLIDWLGFINCTEFKIGLGAFL